VVVSTVLVFVVEMYRGRENVNINAATAWNYLKTDIAQHLARTYVFWGEFSVDSTNLGLYTCGRGFQRRVNWYFTNFSHRSLLLLLMMMMTA